MVLSGKVALVVGGTSGIGAATAAAFQREGASVAVTGDDAAALRNAREAMPGMEVVELDTLDTVAVARLIDNVADEYGKIDILFLCPSMARPVPIDLVDEAFFDREFDLNVRGLYFTLKSALAQMSAGGSIIFAWSSPGWDGVAGASVEGAARAALQSVGRQLSSELAPRNIRVNSISPAFRSRSIRGNAKAIVAAALFLASDASAVVTGAELLVGAAGDGIGV